MDLSPKFSFFDIDENSEFVPDIIALGDKNKQTLGFFPEEVFRKFFESKKAFAAVKDGKLAGYILWAKNNRLNSVTITHFCISPEFRGHKVSDELFAQFKGKVKGLCSKIRISCRQDEIYAPARKLWARLGFKPIGEKPGRAIKGSVLDIWAYDFHEPSLFDNFCKNDAEKILVAIDANIFFCLNSKDDSRYDKVKILNEDWIKDQFEFRVSSEIFNEIKRHPDPDERERCRNRVGQELRPDRNYWEKLESELKAKLKVNNQSDSWASDICHLSCAIASGVSFFLTFDREILNKKDSFLADYRLEVCEPLDFVLKFHEIDRAKEYEPARFFGISNLSVSRISSKELDSLCKKFQNSAIESLGLFSEKIRRNMGDFDSDIGLKIFADSDIYAFTLFTNNFQESQLEISVFRVSKVQLEIELYRSMLLQIIRYGIDNKLALIDFQEEFIPQDLVHALVELGFTKNCSNWVKVIGSCFDTLEECSSWLNDLKNAFPQTLHFFKTIEDFSENCGSPKNLIGLEKMLWPGKILFKDTPSYVIAIKPKWAKELFDFRLASEYLINSNQHAKLMLGLENAYYSGMARRSIKFPSRILWYVTQDESSPSIWSKAITACSYLDEVIVDYPKSLFKKFKRLGTFDWVDLMELSHNDLQKEITAFKFSFTELFEIPVSFKEVNNIWKEKVGCKFNPQSPVQAPLEVFKQIYRLGFKK